MSLSKLLANVSERLRIAEGMCDAKYQLSEAERFLMEGFATVIEAVEKNRIDIEKLKGDTYGPE